MYTKFHLFPHLTTEVRFYLLIPRYNLNPLVFRDKISKHNIMIYGFYLREVVNHLNPFCSDLRVNRLFGLHPELLYDRNKYYQRMDILDYSLLPFELYFGCQFLLVLTLPWLSIAQGRRKWVEMGR